MALTESLRILITANGAQAEREFNKVGAAAKKGLGTADTATQQWGRTLTTAGVAMAAFGGIALVGLFKAASAADEENRAILQLQNSIQNSPALIGATTDAFLAQADALEDVTKFGDDTTVSAQAMLATFRLTQDEILTLTPLTQDLASKFGVDLNKAAVAVGKAMMGNASTLQRWGVFVEDGSTHAEQLANVIAGLQENAGGFAENEGQTMAGQLAILKNNLADVAENIGAGALPAFNSLIGGASAIGDAFSSLNPDLQKTIGMIATFGSLGLIAGGGFLILAGQALKLGTTFSQLRTTMVGTRLGLFALSGAFGPVTLALTAGAALLAGYAIRKQEATEKTNAFAEALRAEASGAEDSVNSLIAHTAATDPAIKRFEEFGVSLADVTAALGGNDAAWRRIDDAVNSYQDGLDDTNISIHEHIGDSNRFRTAIDQQRDALSAATGEVDAEEEAMATLAETTDDVTDATTNAGLATQRLGDAWDGLTNRLGDFSATLAAQDALFQLRDGLAAAREEGGISAEEMVGLNQNLVSLIQSYADVATEANTAADGTINYHGRNRDLRESLGALASFIPAELRPQFRNLTRDVTNAGDAARDVPDRIDIVVTVAGVETVVEGLHRIYQAAVDAANAVGQTGGSLAGGGTYSPPSGGGGEGGSGNHHRDSESMPITEAGMRRVMERTISPVVVMN